MLPKPLQDLAKKNVWVNGIINLAEVCAWDCIDWQENIKMLSFKKGTSRVNVYYSTMTVGTCLDHPKTGKTQMFRRDVTITELRRIFTNPRVHTDKGYYKK